MQITLTIKPESIAVLMISAMESGDPVTTASKGGWCDGIYYHTKRSKPPEALGNGLWYTAPEFYESPDFQIEVVEVDDETTGHRTGHIITRSNLLAGLKTLAEKFPHHFADLLTGNTDAATADIFLQAVVFGEEKYA